MNRILYPSALVAGLAAVAYVAWGHAGSSPLTLVMTALIAAFYLLGALELARWRRDTAGLGQALDGLTDAQHHVGQGVLDSTGTAAPLDTKADVPRLDDWLARVPPALRDAVRQRIEADRPGLPGPALTPYLVGLLVLLGMLGTFLGMVVTLQGTVLALDSSSDLAGIRASLAAPIRGLGLAFGTSVAGVCASAMLGLMSVLARRERLGVAQRLDQAIAAPLRVYSRAHQRAQALEGVQAQARLMPQVVDRLEALIGQLGQQSQALHANLLASQDRFQREAQQAYVGLAESVDRTLRHSLVESAQRSGAALQPLLAEAMAGITRQASVVHEEVAHSVSHQISTLSQRFAGSVDQISATWREALSQQQAEQARSSAEARAAWVAAGEQVAGQAVALVGRMEASHQGLLSDLAAQDAARQHNWAIGLADVSSRLQVAWQQAGAQALAQQEAVCATLAQTGQTLSAQTQEQARATVAEVGRLVQAASEAPRVAAELMGELRTQLSRSLAQDNALLDERRQTLETMQALLHAVNHGTTAQGQAIDDLVATTAAMVARLEASVTAQLAADSVRLSSAAVQVTGSAVEVASLGEAFGQAVVLFGDANARLMVQLQQIESALAKTLSRSDEQLAYYVAQAREVIDLSLLSQQQLVDQIEQRTQRGTAVIAEAG